jgi:glycosyltransferase involved in cell wall biosynthesis
MLNPLSLLQSRTKKKIARFLGVKNYLSSAACLHATSQQEADNIRKLGTRNPIAVVAIGLDLTEHCRVLPPSTVEKTWPRLKQKKILFVLSRIHPQKGLLNLVHVWGRLSRQYSDWHLVIAGPDHNGHEAELKAAVEKTEASKHTTFAGPVYGEFKKQLFAACDVFVLPTFSENFGIVIAESLAAGKPVITTKGTPWQELETHNCGWWIDIGQDPLEAAIEQALDLSDDTRAEMGARGRALIEENYSWPKIAAQMVDVYRWLSAQGDRPDCVRLE